jgi:hypothetical protein
MMETQLWTHPSSGQYAAASAICHLRFPTQKSLDGPERYAALARAGVQLVVLLDEDQQIHAVSFLLPVTLPGGVVCRFQFQVASRPGMPGGGALVMRHAMRVGAPLIGLGITPEAERLHAALRWKQIPGVWRGIHPLRARSLVQDYRHRLPARVPTAVWQGAARLYDGVALGLRSMFALGAHCTASPPPDQFPERTHLPWFRCGPLLAVKVGPIARVLAPADAGSLREHAALGQALRRAGANAVEILLTTHAGRSRALWRGYLPLPIELWIWDPHNELWPALEAARGIGWSFLETDKVI